MRYILFIVSVVMFSFSCEQKTHVKTAEELRQDLVRMEMNVPLYYLSDSNMVFNPQEKKVRDAGLFRDAEYAPDGAKITGYVNNTATIATYKDIVVKVSFFSKTKSLIDSKSFTVFEFYKPSTRTPFSIRLESFPKAMDQFGIEIVSATAVRH
jgi:hypothetical protein